MKTKLNKKIKRGGYALGFTILVLFLVVTFASSFVVLTHLNHRLSRKRYDKIIARQAAIGGIEEALYQLDQDKKWKKGFNKYSLELSGAFYTVTFNKNLGKPYSTNNSSGVGDVIGYNGRLVPSGMVHIVSIGEYGQSESIEQGLVTLSGSSLFEEDFTQGLNQWNQVMGNYFYLRDNKYYIGRDHGQSGEIRTFLKDKNWTDFTLVTKARLLHGWGYGIYFRATNVSRVNGYIFQYDPHYNPGRGGSFLFRKIVGGAERAPFACTYRKNSIFKNEHVHWWYQKEREIKIEVKGNTFKAYVDGELVVTGVDNSYTSGTIGLRTWQPSQAYFDSIKITGGQGVDTVSRW